MGEMPALSGMVLCADCGAKMYQVRVRSFPQSEYMVCASHRKMGKEICPSHQIRNSIIEKYVLVGLREIVGYVQANEDEFVEMITKKSRAKLTGTYVTASGNWSRHRRVSASRTRLSRVSTITTSRARFPNECFAKMSENYEAEQKTLECRVTELRGLIASQQESSVNVDSFIARVRKNTRTSRN